MAKLPSRTCGKPGCLGIIRDDTCSACGPIVRTGWTDDNRGTSKERGYDEAWTRTRKEFILQATLEAATSGVSAYPICELCNTPVVDQIHVDHIVPHKGLDDPMRLDMDNLRITHMRCHMRRTARQRHETQ